MSLKTTDDPDVLVDRTARGFLILVGLLFVLGGIGVMLSAPDVVHLEWKGGEPPMWFGGILYAAGVALILGRSGVILNRRERTVVKSWGLLVPMYKNKRSLADFRHVRLTSELRRRRMSIYTVYPVRLVGEGKPLEVEEPQDFLKARALAEQIAKFLHLPLDEVVGGAEVVRDADHLDESLRQQAHRTGASQAMPEPPLGMRSRCEVDGAQATLTLPGAGFQVKHFAAFAIVVMGELVFALGLLLDLLPPSESSLSDVLAPVLLLTELFGILGFVVIADALRRTKVIATPEALRVEEGGLVSWKVTEIPTDEIKEFILPRPGAITTEPTGVFSLYRPRRPGLTARSDKKMVEFGGNLSPEEQRWVHAVITKVLSA